MRIAVATLALLAILSALASGCQTAPKPCSYFGIQVVDGSTGRGVPLVELETVNHLTSITDSNGLIAFHEPSLMNREVFFHVRSHGHSFPKDAFGYAGTRLTPKAGERAEIKIERRNIAERLYRVTGEGVYRDTALLGEEPPIREPLLNGQVLGQDSVQAAPFRDKIYWFWGDTNRPAYPLGNFHASGATSYPPKRGGLDPNVGIDLEYFVDENGASKKMCPLTGPGMVWLNGLLTVEDGSGRTRLLAHYARMKSLDEMREHGLVVFNDSTETFEKVIAFDLEKCWQAPRGRPVRVRRGDEEFFYFATPFCTVRAKADMKSLTDQASYEAFTCLKRDGESAAEVSRGADGKLLYAWRTATDPVGPKEERELIEAGKIREDEARYQPKDTDTGEVVFLHSGSVNWNPFRRKWIMVAVQASGTSFLGEVWFTEADSPEGPWMWAKKIVTHDHYSFYNPAHHPFFDQEEGRIIYFEGTYASAFSGREEPTPRYDYNQIMYRLDLGDPRLTAPQDAAPA